MRYFENDYALKTFTGISMAYRTMYLNIQFDTVATVDVYVFVEFIRT